MEIQEKETVRSKVLKAAIKMFMENGYEKTTMRAIATASQVNYGSLMFAFKDKDSIVSELVGYVIDCQFEMVSKLLKNKTQDKILQYAVETVLQLHIAESSEHMREMYNVSYSMPKSSLVVYGNITKKLQNIFGSHLPHLKEKDFYELEIASAGIMRNFISMPCNMYFTMERKVNRFLETTMLVYRVPEKKIEECINFVKHFDFVELAEKTVAKMLEYVEHKI